MSIQDGSKYVAPDAVSSVDGTLSGSNDNLTSPIERSRSFVKQLDASARKVNHSISSIVISQDIEEIDTHDTFDKSMHEIDQRLAKEQEKPRLTLSAFRRPEHTVWLTNASRGRQLETYYDLHSKGCGVLGHGAFSTVRLAVHRSDGTKVAIKSIAKHDALRSNRLRYGGSNHMEEWEILRRMRRHPHIISLLDVFETDEEIQLVMEYCKGGELFDAIQKKRNRSHAMRRGQYTEAEAAMITGQILKALSDIHAHGIVHRDVKPENILLADDDENSVHVKLCDFGMARSLIQEPINIGAHGEESPFPQRRSRAFSMFGSNYYVAPEVTYGSTYDSSIDIYSLGVTLYVLLCGSPPVFTGNEMDAEVMFPNLYWKDVSNDATDLVRNMLSPDASERLTAKEALNHPWIRKSMNDATSSSSITQYSPRHVDLDLVRNRLYQSFPAPNVSALPKRAATAIFSARKRPCVSRSSSLMALADLYRNVSKSPSSALKSRLDVTRSPNRKDIPVQSLTKDDDRKIQAPALLF